MKLVELYVNLSNLSYIELDSILFTVQDVPMLNQQQFEQLARTSFDPQKADRFLESTQLLKHNVQRDFDDRVVFKKWTEAVSYWNDVCDDIYGGDDFDS